MVAVNPKGESPFQYLLGVGPELFDGSGPERVASGNQHAELVLNEPEADLGEVGGLTHTVHAAERHDVRPVVGLGLEEK